MSDNEVFFNLLSLEVSVPLLYLIKGFGEQGWRSGESTRFPPMWPGFDSRTRHHMWVEFVVGSRPCSEGFSAGSPVFLPPQKPTLPNSNSIGNSRATGLSVARLLCASLVKQSLYYYYYYRILNSVVM